MERISPPSIIYIGSDNKAAAAQLAAAGKQSKSDNRDQKEALKTHPRRNEAAASGKARHEICRFLLADRPVPRLS